MENRLPVADSPCVEMRDLAALIAVLTRISESLQEIVVRLQTVSPAAEPQQPVSSDNLSVRQAAVFLGCSADIVYQLCSQRKLAHCRVPPPRGKILIAKDDLLAFLQSTKKRAEAEERKSSPLPPPVKVKLKHLALS